MTVKLMESGIVISENDAFFVDTNTIISSIYPKDRFHEASFVFISYLQYKNATLCINEIVVSEALNTLARLYFLDDELEDAANRSLDSVEEIKHMWYRKIVKNDPVSLSYYNQLASRALLPFIQQCKLVPSRKKALENALHYSYTIPLASSDAMIANAAIEQKVKGILSFDSDMHKIGTLDIYKTELQNAFFLKVARKVISSLDDHFEDFLRLVLHNHEKSFDERYPQTLKAKR